MSTNGRTTPKLFQQTAIDSGVAIFREAKRVLDATEGDAAGRAQAVGHHGVLLVEAPTGAGKTLIAGHLVETFSTVERVVWFWFAPFKGLVGQTASALRAEFPGLRLRELSEDRNAADSREGDVWVTTWQTVATKVKDRRNVHRPGEQNLTVEELLEGMRARGLRVGVVVDEAHHGFFTRGGAETQAMRFYRESLRPEYTVLITATPDDADIARFQKDLGLTRLNPLRISRREPVDEGLIKGGIQCVAFVAPEEQRALVDFEGTALREGAALHRRVKAELAALGVQLVPLMLVQVDSTAGSVDRAKERLLREGFTEEQIAVHTAEEPDSSLLALANDESREVLVFKTAVALGFDAPRAGILVSMRAARDEDFGVQLVGRILRVHRRLQGRARTKTLPELLRHGYVFLADSESQAGLDLAGQRINKLQTEYASVSPTTVIVRTAGRDEVHLVGPTGQVQLFTLQVDATGGGQVAGETGTVAETPAAPWRASLVDLLAGGFSTPTTSPTGETTPAPALSRAYRYDLRADVPRRFKTQVVSPDNDATEEDCAQRFIVSSRDIVRALAAKIDVQTRKLEIFTQQLELGLTKAKMDPEQAARAALRVLTKNETFDPRELRRALLRKLKATMREEGLTEVADDEDQSAAMLDVILATHPELLYEAQKAALAAHFEVEEAEEELPQTMEWDTPLVTSRLNVYRAVPPGLNSWETAFAGLLDADAAGVVRWWHRNLPHKAWSVQVVLSDGRGFFPDFVIGIEGRKHEDGALLADPKFQFELTQEQPKTRAEHPVYGRVLILSRQGGSQWMTVRYDERQRKAVLDREFRLAGTAGF
jgi:hypothetical protein